MRRFVLPVALLVLSAWAPGLGQTAPQAAWISASIDPFSSGDVRVIVTMATAIPGGEDIACVWARRITEVGSTRTDEAEYGCTDFDGSFEIDLVGGTAHAEGAVPTHYSKIVEDGHTTTFSGGPALASFALRWTRNDEVSPAAGICITYLLIPCGASAGVVMDAQPVGSIQFGGVGVTADVPASWCGAITVGTFYEMSDYTPSCP